MTQETAVGGSDLEQLQRRFEEYRSLRPSRGRLPTALCKEAAEAARWVSEVPRQRHFRQEYPVCQNGKAVLGGGLIRSFEMSEDQSGARDLENEHLSAKDRTPGAAGWTP